MKQCPLKRIRLPRWVPIFCGISVGLLFLFSGLGKIISPDEFALALFRYHMLPAFLVNIFAIWMGWLELTAALAVLVWPRSWRAGLLAILFMLLIFSAAIGLNLARGLDIACGCFNTSRAAAPMGWWSLLRNLGLILLTVIALKCSFGDTEDSAGGS